MFKVLGALGQRVWGLNGFCPLKGLKGACGVLTYVYISVCTDRLRCTGFKAPALRLLRKALFLFLGSYDWWARYRGFCPSTIVFLCNFFKQDEKRASLGCLWALRVLALGLEGFKVPVGIWGVATFGF